MDEPITLPRPCEVAFCVRRALEYSRSCEAHLGLINGNVEFDVIGDPVTGDDAYIYSGVEYRVTVALPRVRCTFVGTFVPSPLAWRLTFKGSEYATELDCAKDAVVSIVAM